MKLQEVAQQVQMTKRAIKYYEEKGLLQVEKDENGYRRYTEEHIAVLQQIQVYRKLGMELSAIQRILHDSQVEQEELQRLEEQMQRHLEQQVGTAGGSAPNAGRHKGLPGAAGAA